MKELKFIEINSELGAGTRGASLGVGALKTAASNKGYTYFRNTVLEEVPCLNDVLWQDTNTPYAKHIGSIVEIYNRTCNAVDSSLKNNEFPLVLSGDHSTAGGTISGIKAAYPDKRIGVVWIDAHADLHTPYTTPSGNVHGMPLATALQIDNKRFQRNTPSSHSTAYWEQLKDCGAKGDRKVLPEDLVFIAVRDTEEEEDGLLNELNITNHTVESVREYGVDQIVEATLQQLSECDVIYISFDVDSMDCNLVSHGTGTPVENGLTPNEARDIMLGLLKSDKVICLEIVEINPCLDEKTNTMAETAADILNDLVKEIKAKG